MKRLLTALTLIAALLLNGCGGERQYEYTFTDAFDTVITIKGYAPSRSEFDSRAELIAGRLREYHVLFDIYDEHDGVNGIRAVNDNAGKAPVETDGAVTGLLDLCGEFYDATGGRVNAAMGSVLRLWHDARETETLPDPEALAAAAEHCSFDNVTVDGGSVHIADPGLSLDVGAFAKGYAVQLACEGVTDSWLINAGGNIYATGPKPGGEAWVVGITDPRGDGYVRKVKLYSGAVVTSGDYERGFYSGGRWYSHIIDPDTLYPAERYASVTVMGGSSAYADALSTALFVLGKDEGLALAEKYGISAMWVYDDGTVETYDPDRAYFTND